MSNLKPAFSDSAMHSLNVQQANALRRKETAFSKGLQRTVAADSPRNDESFPEAFPNPTRDGHLPQTDELLQWQQAYADSQQAYHESQQRANKLVAHCERERTRAHRSESENERLIRTVEAGRREASNLEAQVNSLEAEVRPLQEKLCGSRGRFEHLWGLDKVRESSFALSKSLDILCSELVRHVLSQPDREEVVRRWCPVQLAPARQQQAEPCWPQLVEDVAHRMPTAQQRVVLEALLRGTLVEMLHAQVWRGMFHGLPQLSWPLLCEGGLDLTGMLQQAANGAVTTVDAEFVEAALHFYRKSARGLSQQVAALDLAAICQGVNPEFAAAAAAASHSTCAGPSSSDSHWHLQQLLQQVPASGLPAPLPQHELGSPAGVRDQVHAGNLRRQPSRHASGRLRGVANPKAQPAGLPGQQQHDPPRSVALWCKQVAASLVSTTSTGAGRSPYPPAAAPAWSGRGGEGGPAGSLWGLALRVAADAIHLQYTATAVHPELVVTVIEQGGRLDERMAELRRHVNVAPGATWVAQQGLFGGGARGGQAVQPGAVLLSMLPAVSFVNPPTAVAKGMVCIASHNMQRAAWDLL
jgi:hypothetical protein